MARINNFMSYWSYSYILCYFIIVSISDGAFSSPTITSDSNILVNAGLKPNRAHVRTAKRLYHDMNHSMDPCDNFYEFACGNFKKSRKIVSSSYPDDRFLTTQARIVGNLHAAILKLDSRRTVNPFNVVKKFYDVCVNETNSELQGYKPLIKILTKLNGWPLMSTRWNKAMFSWEELVYEIRRNGYTGDDLIGLRINVDPTNSSKLALHILNPDLEFSYERFSKGLNDLAVKDYFAYMRDIVELLGVPRKQAKYECFDILKFEMDLSKIVDESNQVGTSFKVMSIQDLKSTWPRMNWDTLLKKVLLPYVKIDDNEKVVVSNPHYITAFEKLINKTPSKVKKHYALWKVIQSSVPYLNNKIQKKLAIYKSANQKKITQVPRPITCMLEVIKEFKLAVDSLYIRSFINPSTKSKVTEMTNNIRNELLNVIDKTEWLDKKTKNDAEKQMKNMTQLIAYADELLDDNKLKNYYKDLEIDELSYLQTSRNINLFQMKKVCKSLKKDFNNSDWTILDSWTAVNVHYVGCANRIEIPVGILQNPFYTPDRPSYVNYGVIGSIIGHELFHVFDRTINSYDHIKMDLIPSKLPYIARPSCFVDQYNNYTMKDIGEKVDRQIQAADSIADVGGIRLAYLAYQKWVSNHTQEAQLPDLPYTPNQLFWISMANTWCSVDGLDVSRSVAKSFHSPNEFKVVGALSNIPEFSVDFKCPVGSRMNQQSKCSLW